MVHAVSRPKAGTHYSMMLEIGCQLPSSLVTQAPQPALDSIFTGLFFVKHFLFSQTWNGDELNFKRPP